MNAACTTLGLALLPRPSSVVTGRFATDDIGVMHELTSAPAINTEQAPHWPLPQPKRGPLSSRSLRSAYSNGICGSASSARLAPLPRSVILAIVTPHVV